MTLEQFREAVRAQLAAEVCEAIAADPMEVERHVRFRIAQDIATCEASINHAEDCAESEPSRTLEDAWRAYGARQIAHIRELLEIRKELDTRH